MYFIDIYRLIWHYLIGDFMFFDICIVGGGAAGLIAAIAAKQKNKKLNIAILERLDRVGKKIALTGNGRCNITNKNITAERYHGKNVSFSGHALSLFGTAETLKFFENIGLPIIFEGDKGYPRSLQAASVTDALRFKANELGVSTFTDTLVEKIKKDGNSFLLFAGDKTFKSTAVIAAGGLLSGGQRLGCDGQLLGVLGALGIKSVEPSPAIVQLKTNPEYVRQLKGIKVNADVFAKRGEKTIKSDFGEVLFCDYGLSGPPILQLSGRVKQGDRILLDLAPEYTKEELKNILISRKDMLSSRKNDEFLSGLLNKRLGQVLIKCACLSLGNAVYTITNGEIEKLCNVIKGFEFSITGNTGFANSQVSSGGIETSQFCAKTLMCNKISGLFAAGEILDIDGDCGGFNLQWAWASGFLAGQSAAEFVK